MCNSKSGSLRARAILFGTALMSLGLFSGVASAATAECPDPAAPGSRIFTLTFASGSASCFFAAAGNVDNNAAFNSLVTAGGYQLLDKSDDLGSGALPGSLTLTPPTNGLSGTFSILAAGFTSFILVLKSGAGQLDPDFAAFSLTNLLSGNWSITGQQALSHGNLYGTVAAIPIPGALPLFGSGLALIGLLGWRRTKKESIKTFAFSESRCKAQ